MLLQEKYNNSNEVPSEVNRKAIRIADERTNLIEPPTKIDNGGNQPQENSCDSG